MRNKCIANSVLYIIFKNKYSPKNNSTPNQYFILCFIHYSNLYMICSVFNLKNWKYLFDVIKYIINLSIIINSNNGGTMDNKWWNDGESKFKKSLYISFNWWNDGNNKVLKAFYFSLFLHFLLGFFWLITIVIGYIF